jgi:hypothetical protein
VLHVIGGILAILYGASMVAAVLKEGKSPPQQTWAPPLHLGAAAGLVITGILGILAPKSAWWGVFVCLVAIQALAINAGFRMYGRPHWSHHAVRLGITVSVLLLLAL